MLNQDKNLDIKTEKILEDIKGKNVGIFCDGANIFYGCKKYKWQIDFNKFKIFIKNYCDLKFINYYLAVPSKNDNAFLKTNKFLDKIKDFVTIKKKELKYISIGKQFLKKGNMDVEIVLDVVREINNLDIIIIMSGDSDFLELKNYVIKENNKKIIFLGYQKNMGWEIRQCKHIYLEKIKNKIFLF